MLEQANVSSSALLPLGRLGNKPEKLGTPTQWLNQSDIISTDRASVVGLVVQVTFTRNDQERRGPNQPNPFQPGLNTIRLDYHSLETIVETTQGCDLG